MFTIKNVRHHKAVLIEIRRTAKLPNETICITTLNIQEFPEKTNVNVDILHA